MSYSLGSSEQFLPAAPAVIAPEVRDKLAALATDEPLPPIHTSDGLRLLVQSPRRIFAYWTFKRDPFETLRKAFGRRANRYHLVIRLFDYSSGEEFFYDAPFHGSQFMDARPNTRYGAQVGFYAQGQPFIRLLSSGVVQTPRVGVSPLADITPAFHLTPNEFMRVLSETGYTNDALEVGLEAADARTDGMATRELSSALAAGSDMPQLSDEDRAELRRLLAALALGSSLDDLQLNFSETLARWLIEAGIAKEQTLAAERLREKLQSVFDLNEKLAFDRAGFALEDVGDSAQIARLPFAVGRVSPLPPNQRTLVWLPSMSAELIRPLAESLLLQEGKSKMAK